MEHKDKINAIQFIRPNADFTLRGEEIEWSDKNQSEPTNEEIEAGFIAYKADQEAKAEATATAKATVEAKLAALGLTADDLKALGL
jgi:hypothetical protein